MTRVFLGLGSNVRPGHYLPLGIRDLRSSLGPLELSPVYAGPAIGFAGAPFWNLVVRARVSLSVGELQTLLRSIEYTHGRPRETRGDSPRTLDIDILTFGDAVGVVDGVTLPRDEVLRHAFVLRPLAELAPEEMHPVAGRSYSDLWSAFDQGSQPLSEVCRSPRW